MTCGTSLGDSSGIDHGLAALLLYWKDNAAYRQARAGVDPETMNAVPRWPHIVQPDAASACSRRQLSWNARARKPDHWVRKAGPFSLDELLFGSRHSE